MKCNEEKEQTKYLETTFIIDFISFTRILIQNVLQHLLQAFSSDSSLQSGLSLQNNSFSIHSPLPHDNLPSGQTGSSVLRIGKTLRGSVCTESDT